MGLPATIAPSSIRQVFFVSPFQPAKLVPSKSVSTGTGSAAATHGEVTEKRAATRGRAKLSDWRREDEGRGRRIRVGFQRRSGENGRILHPYNTYGLGRGFVIRRQFLGL